MSELLKNKHHYFCPLGINGIKIPLLLSITPQIINSMKSLYIMRHAKAAQHNTASTDFERELIERGFNDAEEMGKRLSKTKPQIQVIIASPSLRTKQTAETVAKQLGIDNIIYNKNIYEASPSIIARIISETSDTYDKILLIGHNPTVTDTMLYFCDMKIDSLPTAGIYLITFETNNWGETTQQKGIFNWADWPKN